MVADQPGLPVTAKQAGTLARLHTAARRGARTGDLDGVERLHHAAVSSPAIGERVALMTACAVEAARCRCASVDEGASVWDSLLAQGKQALGPDDPLLLTMQSWRIRYLGRGGHPADLDEAVRLCRQIRRQRRDALGKNNYWSRLARVDLAAALRERGGNDDLAESRRILRREVTDHDTQPGNGDHRSFIWATQSALAHTLVRLAEAAHGLDTRRYAAEAAELTTALVDIRRDHLGRDDAPVLRAQVLHAHALILLGSLDAGDREIRYVKAVARRTGVCLSDGWTDQLMARTDMALAGGTERGSA